MIRPAPPVAGGGSIRTVAETGDLFETLGLFPSANEDGTVAFAATLRAGVPRRSRHLSEVERLDEEAAAGIAPAAA